jgi:hypothetical protein
MCESRYVTRVAIKDTMPVRSRMVVIEAEIHFELSLDNFSGLETIVPFHSEDVAVAFRRMRMGVTNTSIWVGMLVYGQRIPLICRRKSNE